MADSRARDTEGRFITESGSPPEVRLEDDETGWENEGGATLLERLANEERGGTLA